MHVDEEKLEAEAKVYMKDKTKNVNNDDVKRVIENEDKIVQKLNEKSPLDRFFTDIKLLLGLLKDYYYGNYRSIPYKSIASIATALLYIINPVDIIPDVIPMIGQIDDALVFSFCLKMIESDLEKYQTWQVSHKSSS